MRVFNAPEIIHSTGRPSVFLAGTIDNGDSINWLDQVISCFSAKEIDIYNPRRRDWDSRWKQSLDDANFCQQVNWELDALQKAGTVILNFLPGSQSPISLLELGLFAASRKLKVCCPSGYWKAGNVQLVCRRYGIPVFEHMHELLKTFD